MSRAGAHYRLSRLYRPRDGRFWLMIVLNLLSAVLAWVLRTYPLVPLAMAAGVVVPMMCGVEHDYIISSLDKLSAIPGFKAKLSNDQFATQLAKINGAICAQNEDLAPADGLIFSHVDTPWQSVDASSPTISLVRTDFAGSF